MNDRKRTRNISKLNTTASFPKTNTSTILKLFASAGGIVTLVNGQQHQHHQQHRQQQQQQQQSFYPTCSNWNKDCPVHAPLSMCVKNPCDDPGACPEGQGLTCHANYCGGCRAVCCVDSVFCPLDAKLCPDGVTYVTRNHADGCRFFPCEDGAGEGDSTETEKDGEDDEHDYFTVCADDVRTCPDGTTEVTRNVANDCEFFPCEGEREEGEEDGECANDVEECDDGTLVSRDVERCCLFKPCPDLTFVQLMMKNMSDRFQCLFD